MTAASVLIQFIHRLCAQAQEDIQSRPTPGISVTQGHSQQNKSMQQCTSAGNPESSGQRKRLVSTVDDFTDFVWFCIWCGHNLAFGRLKAPFVIWHDSKFTLQKKHNTYALRPVGLINVPTYRTLHLQAVCVNTCVELKARLRKQAPEKVFFFLSPHCCATGSAVKLFIRLCQVQKQKCCNAKIHRKRQRKTDTLLLTPTHILQHGRRQFCRLWH